jgi:hypothetical protein
MRQQEDAPLVSTAENVDRNQTAVHQPHQTDALQQLAETLSTFCKTCIRRDLPQQGKAAALVMPWCEVHAMNQRD